MNDMAAESGFYVSSDGRLHMAMSYVRETTSPRGQLLDN